MNRTPVYHEKNSDYRIVPFPNEQWQCQHRRGGVKGENANPLRSVKHFDPWYALARPTGYSVAKAQLDTLTPV